LPCRVTPPLGARAQYMTASTIPPLSVWSCGTPWRTVWLCGTPGGHKGAQTCIGLTQSPSRSLETVRPVGRASAWGQGFGIPTRSPDPLVRRAGRDHPFPVSAGAPWRERDVTRRVGHGCLPDEAQGCPKGNSAGDTRVGQTINEIIPAKGCCTVGKNIQQLPRTRCHGLSLGPY